MNPASTPLSTITTAYCGARKVIKVKDICAFRAAHKYVEVYFIENGECKMVDIVASLNSLQPHLPDRFHRFQRSVIVDIDRMVKYKYIPETRAALVTLDKVDRLFPVSRRRQSVYRKMARSRGIAA